MSHHSDCVIFVHIGKTAGTTLSVILIRQYAEKNIFAIDKSKGITLETFKTLPDEKKLQISLLRGHILFGLHGFLPQPTTYITMLRDPVKRVVSLYYHILREKTHYLHEAVSSQKMTLEEYAVSGLAPELDNFQLRALVGYKSTQIPVGECDRTLLAQAKENVKNHFSVVGITERFDDSLLLMKERLGWAKLPTYKSMNVATNKPKREREIPESTVRLIQEYNALDCELYDWACVQLEEQLTQSLRDSA